MKLNQKERQVIKQSKKKARNKLKEPGFKGKLIVSIIVAICTTALFSLRYFKHFNPTSYNLTSWTIAGILGAVFLLAFGITMGMFYKPKFKNKMSKTILFLIISVIAGALVSYGMYDKATMSISDLFVNFSLCTGICYAAFEIFSMVNFELLHRAWIRLIKNIMYMIIIPSMFLIVILMGKIDTANKFIPAAKIALMQAGSALAEATIKVLQTIYNLGKHQYSVIFVIAIFAFLCLFAIYDFVEKTKEDIKNDKLKKKLKRKFKKKKDKKKDKSQEESEEKKVQEELNEGWMLIKNLFKKRIKVKKMVK